MRTSRSVPAVPESTRAARRFVLQAAGDAPPALRDAIAVMVAELAMNAVQHARTDFEVTIDRTGAIMRVEVTDSSGSRPAPQPMPPPQSPRGRGLPIVDRLADAWGVIPSPHGPGKSIWFRIAMPPVTPEHTAAGGEARPAAGSPASRPEDHAATPAQGRGERETRTCQPEACRRLSLRGTQGAHGCTRITVLPLRRSAGLSAGTASSRVATVPMCVRRRPSRTRSAISVS